MIVVALPYMVTEVLGFDAVLAKRLCGIAEGALAAGGLAGGVFAGIFAKKLDIKSSGNLIIICAVCVFPMGIVLLFALPGIVNYIVIAVCCFIIMVFSTIFTIQMMSFVQAETPQNLVGKVISVIFTVSMCAQPAGNAMYGVLFEVCKNYEFIVILFAGAVFFGNFCMCKKYFQEIFIINIQIFLLNTGCIVLYKKFLYMWL